MMRRPAKWLTVISVCGGGGGGGGAIVGQINRKLRLCEKNEFLGGKGTFVFPSLSIGTQSAKNRYFRRRCHQHVCSAIKTLEFFNFIHLFPIFVGEKKKKIL